MSKKPENDKNNTAEEKRSHRRKALKNILAGTSAVVATKSVPENWTSPKLDSVIIPAHASMTPGSTVD